MKIKLYRNNNVSIIEISEMEFIQFKFAWDLGRGFFNGNRGYNLSRYDYFQIV